MISLIGRLQKMKRGSFALLVLIFLCGCTTTPEGIRTVIQRVEIPIEVPCKAVIPTSPIFNFDNLKTYQDIEEKSRALLADRLLHLGYETELIAALNSCVK